MSAEWSDRLRALNAKPYPEDPASGGPVEAVTLTESDAELAAEYDRARGYDLPPDARPKVRALQEKILAQPPTDWCGHFAVNINGNCMTCAREAERRADMARAWELGLTAGIEAATSVPRTGMTYSIPDNPYGARGAASDSD